MSDHLLNLSALHTAAPGILGVIFGPDGPCDFWSCPVWGSIARNDDRGRTPLDWYWVGGVVGGQVRTYDPREHVDGENGAIVRGAALDCRVPSVAARLLGLCARALDSTATGQAWIEQWCDCWHLRFRRGKAYDLCCWRASDGGAVVSLRRTIPDLAIAPTNEAAFVAALVLALAPRIAALGGAQ